MIAGCRLVNGDCHFSQTGCHQCPFGNGLSYQPRLKHVWSITNRLSIGPVPDQWLDLADEAGLLIQNEYFIWTLGQGQEKHWSKDELIREYKEWMRDNWNHQRGHLGRDQRDRCDVFGDEIIPAVRSLDLFQSPLGE